MGMITEPLLNEFRQEMETTRRVLDRVPGNKLAWKPHAKSMTLGQLASHVASVPGAIAGLVQQDSFDVNQGIFAPPQPVNLQQVFASFEQSMKEAGKCLQTMTDEQASSFLRQWLDVDIAIAQLRQKYVPEVAQVLNARKTATFFQLDRRISMMIDLQLSSQLPIVQAQE